MCTCGYCEVATPLVICTTQRSEETHGLGGMSTESTMVAEGLPECEAATSKKEAPLQLRVERVEEMAFGAKEKYGRVSVRLLPVAKVWP